MSAMDELITFLRRQLDDDERVAHATLGVNVRADLINGKPAPRWVSRGDSVWDTNDIPRVKGTWAREAEHIARWDPARVLAEIQAKRRILDWAEAAQREFDRAGLRTPTPTTSEPMYFAALLAQPYAGRDGWREEWRLTV